MYSLQESYSSRTVWSAPRAASSSSGFASWGATCFRNASNAAAGTDHSSIVCNAVSARAAISSRGQRYACSIARASA